MSLKENKAIPHNEAVETYRVVKCEGSHIVWTFGSQVAVRLSAIHTSYHFTPQKHFSASGTHFCQRPSKPMDLVWLEGLGKLVKIIRHIMS
jgi:hypothetical protein